jgi:hypothetical protein
VILDCASASPLESNSAANVAAIRRMIAGMNILPVALAFAQAISAAKISQRRGTA